MGATVQVVDYRGVLDAGQDPPLVLNIEGEDLGILIGRRAETLAALQYLTRLMVNHRSHRWVNLVVDVEGYKARREEQLVRLAERMAERAVSTGRVVTLEAMPPRERRIVHITLRNHPEVTTQSVGEGEQRKVTIIPRDQ
jgi:spoIIIJ-associated protein